MMNNTQIVIAAYNEEKAIPYVINDLYNHGYHNIIVVDDCSRDKTAEVAEKTGATVLRHIINLGQGAALKTGIDYAVSKGAEIIVTFDADGQHMAKDIPKLVHAIERGYDAALGSRFLGKAENIGIIRKIFLKGGAVIFRLFYNVKVTDSHNGLRALSRRAAKKINMTCNRMEHASEIIEELGKKKIRYREVPVTIRYTDYSMKKGQSTWNGFRILFKMVIKFLGG
ncbi:glycosyltransferase family 2 protein [Candidatus Woesearchaeota archaeon]|nr:glycosyltransferase family 2 protein [Candidatus Woesearchaeota archaeon]